MPALSMNWNLHELESIEDLRRQYREERDKTYDKIKADVERQVRLAAQHTLSDCSASSGIRLKTLRW